MCTTGEASGQPEGVSQLRVTEEEHVMMNVLNRFRKDERGLETIEYAIVAGLIVVGIVAIVASIGVWVKAKFNALNNDLGAP
jgi:Flp pilus assembly pilin Flp